MSNPGMFRTFVVQSGASSHAWIPCHRYNRGAVIGHKNFSFAKSMVSGHSNALIAVEQAMDGDLTVVNELFRFAQAIDDNVSAVAMAVPVAVRFRTVSVSAGGLSDFRLTMLQM